MTNKYNKQKQVNSMHVYNQTIMQECQASSL